MTQAWPISAPRPGGVGALEMAVRPSISQATEFRLLGVLGKEAPVWQKLLR